MAAWGHRGGRRPLAALDKLDRYLYRYLAGRPLATRSGVWPYLSRGDGRWAGWQRQAVRLAAPAAVAGIGYVTAAWPGAGLTVSVAAAAAGLVWARRRLRWRRFRRVYIRPTVAAVREPLGTVDVRLHVDRGLGTLVARLAKPLSPAEQAARELYGRWVEPLWRRPAGKVADWLWLLHAAVGPAVAAVARWLRRPGERPGPRIELTARTPYVAADQRKMISAIISGKIPVSDMIERWDQVGEQVTATWTPRKRPPARVGATHLAAAFDRLAEWEYYLGQGAGDKSVTISLRDDSPHLALSAGSGAGKSVFAQLVAVQVLRRGGRVVLLDRKGSHRWALDLPGVDYCTQPEQMHEALIRAAQLADQRNSDALHEPEDWDPGPRVLVICEELNATVGQLAGYWAGEREKGDPKRSPAVTALNEIAYMGRSAKVNLLAIAQMLTARAIGGPEARENFGVRCLARYTANAWKMLVPEASMPRSSRTLGRWQVVVGGQATETQVCFLTASEAREFAEPVTVVTVTGVTAGEAPIRAVRENRNGEETDAGLMTLREAVEASVVPWAEGAAKMRMSRARSAGRDVPAPVGRRRHADLYRRADLAAWAERERAS